MAFLIETSAIAGPFTAQLSALGSPSWSNLGMIGPEGVRLTRQYAGESITGDRYGETILNGVYRGGNVFLEFTLLEVKLTNAKKLAYPWSETAPATGADEEELGIVGSLWSTNAKQLKLSPVSGTPAYSETDSGGNTVPYRNFGQVILAPGHQIDLQLAARLRVLPLRLLCMPYADSGDSNKIKFYTLSAS